MPDEPTQAPALPDGADGPEQPKSLGAFGGGTDEDYDNSLTRWERWVAGGAGALFGGAGITALVRSGTDGAGTVAAFAFSAVLVVVAVAGTLPERIWAKEFGATIRRVSARAAAEGRREAAEVAADYVAPEYLELYQQELRMRASADEVPLLRGPFADLFRRERFPDSTTALSPAQLFADAQTEVIKAWLLLAGLAVGEGEGPTTFVASDADQRTVLVDLRYNPTSGYWKRLLRVHERAAHPVVVVTNLSSGSEHLEHAQQFLHRTTGRRVQIESVDDRAAFTSALELAFDLDRPHHP